MDFMVQELGSGLAVWFWLRVSHEVGAKMLVWASII
jgi:hypothetical protein